MCRIMNIIRVELQFRSMVLLIFKFMFIIMVVLYTSSRYAILTTDWSQWDSQPHTGHNPSAP